MNLQNLRMLGLAAEHLDPMLDEVVFVGGATVQRVRFLRVRSHGSESIQ